MHKIAVYGSLKKGFYNHARFGMGEPLDTGEIRGAMFLMSSYPHLYREGVKDSDKERSHDVEIYEIEDSVYNNISGMELASGYQEVEMEVSGHEVVVFYSQDNLGYENNWIEAYDAETVPIASVVCL